VRVAIAHGELGAWDGSSRYIVDVAELFARHGHQVSLLCRRCARELPAGLRVQRPDELAAGQRFDLLYGSDLELLPELAPRAARFFYAPLDVLAACPERERWALQHCQRLLRFTRGAVTLLERAYDLPLRAKSLVAVYVSRAYEQLPEPTLQRPSPPELLWIGRLIPSKNVAFLIRAAARLQAPSWRLVIAGDGPERPALQALAQRLGLAGRVQFLGHEPDLSARLARACLLLTASRREHYSLTLMEAAAHGVPCIGLAPDGDMVINACDEQIIHGRTGYLIADEGDMSRRIDELLCHEPRRAVMAHRAWERKRDAFTLDGFWDALQAGLSRRDAPAADV